MADKRKLQGDIERCLKKVMEGVDSFQDIWHKIHGTTNANQKEKFEADLKKEIKKLQRLRDQIKTWLASNDIKDKSILQENRKLIEIQMERFKVVERETKIKAYSKEGLGAVQKIDPAQKEKDEIANWLTDSIDSLMIQVDHYESEIETIHASTKKKKNQKEKLNRIEELEESLNKHKYHIYQLEALLRMLDNGTVEVNEIKRIQDDVTHYIQCSQESDFQENEYIYDDFGLEDFEEFLTKERAVRNSECDGKVATDEESNATDLISSNTSTSASSNSPLCNTVSSIQMKEAECKSLRSVAVMPSANSSGTVSSSGSGKLIASPRSNSSSTETGSSSTISEVPTTLSDSAILELPFTPSPGKSPSNALQNSRIAENCWFVGIEKNEKINGNHPSSSPGNISSLINITCSSPSTRPYQVQNCNSTASQNAVVADCEHQQGENNHCLPAETSDISSRNEQVHGITEPQSISLDAEENISSSSIDIDFPEMPSSIVPVNSDVRCTKFSDGSNAMLNLFHPPSVSNSRPENQLQTLQCAVSVAKEGKAPSPSATLLSSGRKPGGLLIPPIIGDYPVSSTGVLQQLRSQLCILEAVSDRLKYLPDCNKVRSSLNNFRCDVPHYYKSNFPHGDSFEFFQHLSTETLFFIFYYMEGSKAQYWAAKTLKKQSWRFHTRLMLWFQRHEEPRKITEEYEQGTYIYFDYEKWSQRKKDGFVFEYRYLEDIDLN